MRKMMYGVILLAFVISGCATTPSFREAEEASPHATLTFQSYMGIGNALLVVELNGQRPDAWKLNFHRFLTPPGHTTVLLTTCQSPKFGYIGSAMVSIDAEANRTYNFTRDVKKDAVVLTVTRDDGNVVYQGNMSLDPGYCN